MSGPYSIAALACRPTAMLGQLEVVQAVVRVFPATPQVRGPHGIPLTAHAQAGGATAVVDFLQSLDTTP